MNRYYVRYEINGQQREQSFDTVYARDAFASLAGSMLKIQTGEHPHEIILRDMLRTYTNTESDAAIFDQWAAQQSMLGLVTALYEGLALGVWPWMTD